MKLALRQPYKQFFGTIANQVRLDIIECLQRHPHNQTELTQCLPYDQSTISHSLKRLIECGFVHAKQEGTSKTYTLNEETIKPLFELMNNHMEKHCKHICGECQ